MNTPEIIGRTIIDILIWSKMEIGGLDEAEVFVQLDNNKTIEIPWGFEVENLDSCLKKDSQSIFSDLNDIPQYSVNKEGKTIEKILENKKRRDSSIFGRLKKTVGFGKTFPKNISHTKLNSEKTN